MTKFEVGQDVFVRDAMGRWLEKRVAGPPMRGTDFAVIYLAWRDEADGESPWPFEDVRTDRPSAGTVLSHAEYRATVGLAGGAA